MKNFINESERKTLISERERLIIESFNKNFDKIKRTDEVEETELKEEAVELKEGETSTKYKITVNHDGGKKRITTSGSSEEAAIEKVMKAEGCPRSAIGTVRTLDESTGTFNE